ncbi:MAG: hypothetical protein ABI203_03185 [Mucilaginibacter sp.]
MNKRSNRISQFILLGILLTLFSKYIQKVEIFGNKIDTELLKFLAPTVISYLLLEWLMIAKRRRDYIFAIQQLSYSIFSIDPSHEDQFFPGIDPNTLNIMPYSFMCELLTISGQGTATLKIRSLTLYTLTALLSFTLILGFVNYWVSSGMKFDIIWPATWQAAIDEFSFYFCLIISIQALFWIVYYYYIEFKNLDEVKQFISAHPENQPDNPPVAD